MSDFYSAASDFKKARDRAALEKLMARITGRSTELLSYEEVRRAVRASGVVSRTLVDVSLDAIVGSVNRYNDFSRSFLPRLDSDKERWTRVYRASTEQQGLPPIELYRVGDAFFVQDGHHRVSVARQTGSDFIQAYVTQIRSKVPIDPTIQPDELILKAEHADFLVQTNIDALFPNLDFTVTRTGRYQALLEHIAVHQYYLGLEHNRDIPFEEAVISWTENVYLPIVELIKDLGILHDFEGRTEADLYLWICEYRADKKEEFGWEIPSEAAAMDLAAASGENPSTIFGRIGRQLLEVISSGESETEALLDEVRRSSSEKRKKLPLFAHILVPLSGDESGWLALEQAIKFALKDHSKIIGLTVLTDTEAAEDKTALQIKERFLWRCGEFGLEAEFTEEVGSVSESICSHARWTDLVVAGLARPPEDRAASRLTSGIRKLIHNCNRPILFVPRLSNPFNKVLLAYSEGPKSQEALYVAAYLAGNWQLQLGVVHVSAAAEKGAAILDSAREYLDKNHVAAEFLQGSGEVDKAILNLASEHEADLIVMGGYKAGTLVEVIRGSIVDSVLRDSPVPTLVCS